MCVSSNLSFFVIIIFPFIGGELEVMPEPKKKKGSFFNRITKKKKEVMLIPLGLAPKCQIAVMNTDCTQTKMVPHHFLSVEPREFKKKI